MPRHSALVAALAIEFVVIKDELNIPNIRKLAIADMIFGISAGVILDSRLHQSFLLRERRILLLSLRAFYRQACALHHGRAAVDLSHHPVPGVEKIRQAGTATRRRASKETRSSHAHPYRVTRQSCC